MTKVRRGVTDADHLNLLGMGVDEVQAAVEINRRRAADHTEVHTTGETLSAFSLHPMYGLPSPVPGRPGVKG
jgi:hypothetical protein